MIAHIWKTSYGYILEISDGFKVVSEHKFATKVEAKRMAKLAGAIPWNY